MILIFLSIPVLFVLIVFLFMKQAKFGSTPSEKRMERIRQSPNYRNGQFQNLSHTPNFTEGANMLSVLREFLLSDKSKTKPKGKIPSQKTDLLKLDPGKNVLVWFGHSSYFMQIDGKKFLVDPVLSGAASPLAFTTRSFQGSDIYTADDIPLIDYLFMSHDHWDHADHPTLVALQPKIKKVICGLGIGEHFERWGYPEKKLIERDWNEEIVLEQGFTAWTTPARHFSGRGFTRNKALWTSFVLQTPSKKIFIGGDSGYDTHFAEIGKKHGGIDLAILENGQYNKSWKYIHMAPAEVIQAAEDLKAKSYFPVHSGKFALSSHDWDEPLKLVTSLHKNPGIKLFTPMIGEEVKLDNNEQLFSQWWLGVDN